MLPPKLSKYLKEVKVDDFIDVANNKDASLVRLKNELGEQDAQIFIVGTMLYEINEFYNVSNKMSTPQMLETSKIIIDEFYSLTLSDIKLFTKYSKMGVFGECFRMDGSVIMRWLGQYFKMRMDKMESISISENDKRKAEDEKPIPVPKEVDDNMKKLFNKIKQRKNGT